MENPEVPGCSDDILLYAAYERPGTYAITVSKTGYFDFVATDIEFLRTAVATSAPLPLKQG